MLAKLQQDFLNNIFTGSKISKGDLISSSSRLSIYQNNALLGLHAALQNLFPVTEKIVGRDYFKQLTKQFIRQAPQNKGHVNSVGAQFPLFLKENVAALDYLYDVGQLEYNYALAGTARDAEAINFETLATLKPDTILTLHPSASILSFTYNAQNIWQAHQQQPIEAIELKKQENILLIWRDPNDVIAMLSIDKTMHNFLIALSQPFLTVIEKTIQQTKNIEEFQQIFAQLVNNGVFVTEN